MENQGYGLLNLGSISEQTISGAIATGTHGTGLKYGILATHVTHLQIINGLGQIVECDLETEPSLFKAALCSLGVLGIVSQVTIRVEPIQHLGALEYPLNIVEVEGNLENLIKGAENVRFWWFPHTNKCLVWQANKIKPDRRNVTSNLLKNKIRAYKNSLLGHHAFEFLLFTSTFYPNSIPTLNRLSRQVLFRNVHYSEDITYKLFNFDCLFKQYVTEWSIPIEHTVEALRKLRSLIASHNFQVHWPVEIRFVQGDDIYLSPAYGGDKCFIGIIMYRPFGKDVPYKDYFSAFENLMQKFNGRPHWAKVHHWTHKEAQQSYPMWDTFNQIRQKMDPQKIFSNTYTQELF